MKIYFEDGQLNLQHTLPFKYDYRIDAANGYTYCFDALDWIRLNNPDSTVYTNSLVVLDNTYAWNEELKVPEIYIRNVGSKNFIRVDDLTDRELRQGHNIMKMFMNNAFNIMEDK